MTIPPEMLDLARRLLAFEAVAGKPSESAEAAAVLVYEKLRYSLSTFAGVAGFQLLASRALALARTKAPNLSAVQVTADGFLQGLGELEPRMNQDQDGQGAVILIAQLLGLLCTFIGAALTLQLVQDVWPDAAPTIAISETGRDG
jgi:hypothetical protein